MELNIPLNNIENHRVVHLIKSVENLQPRLVLGEIGNKLKQKKESESKVKITNPTLLFTKSGTNQKKSGPVTKVDLTSKKTLINSKIGVKQKDKLIPPALCPKGQIINDGKPSAFTLLAHSQDEVRKVDEQDLKDIFLLGRYVSDIYKYLLDLEMKLPIRSDFLLRSCVSPSMRATLIDWLLDVQIHYSFLLETLHLSVSIIDRYLQNSGTVERRNFQLVGITAMFLACKFEETYYPEVSDFIYMTDNTYSKKEMLDLEREMVKKLDFRLGRPISLTFLRRYSKIVQADQFLHTLGKYFIELALLEFSLAYARPSKIAAAAIYISLCIKEDEVKSDLWTSTLRHYSTYTLQDFHSITKKLAHSIKEAPSSKYKSIRNKYSKGEFLCVSMSKGLQPDSSVLRKLSQQN